MINRLMNWLPNRVVVNGKPYLDPAGTIAALERRVAILEMDEKAAHKFIRELAAEIKDVEAQAKNEYRRGLEDGFASATGVSALKDGAL